MREAVKEILKAAMPRTRPFTVGVVHQVSPLLVTVSGEGLPRPARRLAHYTPAVGDRVIVAVISEGPPQDLVVLGKIA